jgi:hypothetical protein
MCNITNKYSLYKLDNVGLDYHTLLKIYTSTGIREKHMIMAEACWTINPRNSCIIKLGALTVLSYTLGIREIL